MGGGGGGDPPKQSRAQHCNRSQYEVHEGREGWGVGAMEEGLGAGLDTVTNMQPA